MKKLNRIEHYIGVILMYHEVFYRFDSFDPRQLYHPVHIEAQSIVYKTATTIQIFQAKLYHFIQMLVIICYFKLQMFVNHKGVQNSSYNQVYIMKAL